MHQIPPYKPLIILVSLITTICTYAQQNNIQFHNLTPRMGLSEANVTSIYRDHQGFLWIGTYDGLNKYDGVDFQVFQNESTDQHSLYHNVINTIYENESNTLWVGTNRGINKYNRLLDRFERVPITRNKSDVFIEVYKIIEDKNNRLWVAANTGVYLYDKASNTFNRMFIEYYGDKQLPFCEDIAVDKNNDLWFAFSDKILKLSITNDRIDIFDNHNSDILISGESIICIYPDSKNNLWVGYSNSGLDKINLNTGALARYTQAENDESTLSNNYVMSIAEDSLQNIWIGTDNGLNIYNEENDNFTRIAVENDANSLLTGIIQCSYVDAEGTLYFGCRGGGVSIFDKRYSKFKKFTPKKDNPNSLSDKSVIAFTEDDQSNIWIAVDGGGINYFDPVYGNFKHFKREAGNERSLTNDKVLAVMADNNGGLWAGMWQGGLCYFKIVDDDLVFQKKYPFVNNLDPNSTSVFDLYKSPNGDIWVGTYGSGAFKYNAESRLFDQIKLNTNTNKNFKYQSVVDMLDDGEGYMWFCTLDDGLIQYNKETGEHSQFSTKDHDSTGIPSMAVNAIVKDRTGTIWIGTTKGLSRFDKRTKSFKTFTQKNGLPSNLIYGVLEDDNGSIWCSTNRGLAVVRIFNSDSIAVESFTAHDGLQDNYFNPWAYFKSENGNLYFGGIKGFNTFNPTAIEYNTVIPQVHLTEFLLFNTPITKYGEESLLPAHIKETKEIVLNHKQFNFTLRFCATNLIHSERNSYAFIMENLEDNWNYVGTRKSATYTKIPHGEYTFRVKASNNDGVWNDTGTSIAITILPPFWKTWWFRVGVLTIVIAYVLFLFYQKLNMLKHQKAVLEKKVRKRTIELQNANVDLRNQQNEIQKQNEELATNEEELKTLIEELSTTNELLASQKEQLISSNEELNRAYSNAKILNQFGQKATAVLDLENLHELVYNYLKSFLDISAFNIGIFNENENTLMYNHFIDNDVILPPFSHSVDKVDTFNIWCFNKQQPILINNVLKEYQRYLPKLPTFVVSEIPHSVIAIPLTVEEKRLGVLGIVFSRPNAYSSNELTNIQSLASFLSIALDNAKTYKELEKQRLSVVEYNSKLKNALKQLKQAQSQLVHTEKMASLGILTSGVAHEINNPLNYIQGGNNLLNDYFDDHAKTHHSNIQPYVKMINDGISRISTIVQSLLRFNRGAVNENSICDIHLVLDDCCLMLESSVRNRITFLKQYSSETFPFACDESDLHQVFLSILTNAVQAIKEKGEITISTQLNHHTLAVTITDTGCGISADNIDKIATPFFTTRAPGEGAGLGLSIAHTIIEKHKGSITVDSEENVGTTVLISLPLRD